MPATLALVLDLAAGLPAGDLGDIQKRGTLRVLTWNDNLDELFSAKASEAPGLEREILEGFAAVQRLRLEVLPADDPVSALLQGSGDMIAGGLVATAARRKLVNFSQELFPIRHVVVTYKPHPPVTTLDQLRRARVGTQKGTSWAEQVAAAGVPPQNVVDSFGGASEVLRALKTGTVSATVMSVVWAMVEQKRDAGIELGLFVGPSTGVGYAVRKEQSQLLAALDAHLANVRRTPTWSRLVVKYFGEGGLDILKRSRTP